MSNFYNNNNNNSNNGYYAPSGGISSFGDQGSPENYSNSLVVSPSSGPIPRYNTNNTNNYNYNNNNNINNNNNGYSKSPFYPTPSPQQQLPPSNRYHPSNLPPLSIPTAPKPMYPQTSPSARSMTSPSVLSPMPRSISPSVSPSMPRSISPSVSPSMTRSISPSISPSMPHSVSPSQFQPSSPYNRQNSRPFPPQQQQQQQQQYQNYHQSSNQQSQYPYPQHKNSQLPISAMLPRSNPKVTPYAPQSGELTSEGKLSVQQQHQIEKSAIYEEHDISKNHNSAGFSPLNTKSEQDLLYRDIDYDEKDQKGKYGGLMKYLCCGSSKKSKCRTCAIVCCLIFLILIAAIAIIVLTAKQPQVDFLEIGPSPNTDLQPYVKTPTGFNFNFGLKIRVNNPNFFGATFSSINVVAFYPNFNKSIGGGNMTDVKIDNNGNTTINFPFSIQYDKDIDPNFGILFDIASKCGLIGSAGKQKITINYTLTLSLKVLFISIPSPSFKRQANIDCPLQDGKIPNIPGFDPVKAATQFGTNTKRSEYDKAIVLK